VKITKRNYIFAREAILSLYNLNTC